VEIFGSVRLADGRKITQTVAFILILLGFILLADATYDEHRGVASARSPIRSARLDVVARAQNPSQFRGLMAYQWLRASLPLFAGFILHGMVRRAASSDPFSPEFAGSESLDDLHRILTEEEKKRNEPFQR